MIPHRRNHLSMLAIVSSQSHGPGHTRDCMGFEGILNRSALLQPHLQQADLSQHTTTTPEAGASHFWVALFVICNTQNTNRRHLAGPWNTPIRKTAALYVLLTIISFTPDYARQVIAWASQGQIAMAARFRCDCLTLRRSNNNVLPIPSTRRASARCPRASLPAVCCLPHQCWGT